MDSHNLSKRKTKQNKKICDYRNGEEPGFFPVCTSWLILWGLRMWRLQLKILLQMGRVNGRRRLWSHTFINLYMHLDMHTHMDSSVYHNGQTHVAPLLQSVHLYHLSFTSMFYTKLKCFSHSLDLNLFFRWPKLDESISYGNIHTESPKHTCSLPIYIFLPCKTNTNKSISLNIHVGGFFLVNYFGCSELPIGKIFLFWFLGTPKNKVFFIGGISPKCDNKILITLNILLRCWY